MVKQLLIVEDDLKIARFLELELKHEGFEPTVATDGRSGLELALSQTFDLIILDVMLPGLNGMEVCRRIRLGSEVPIIMLTAKDDTMDKVMGLDFGADDYMTKPFAIEELLARIRRIVRQLEKTSTSVGQVMHFGQLSIDLNQRAVKYGQQGIDLTKTEFDLLAMLAGHKQQALSRDQILDAVWGYDCYSDPKVVDVYVRYLRTKIEEPFNEKFIHTIRGVGYCFRYEENA